MKIDGIYFKTHTYVKSKWKMMLTDSTVSHSPEVRIRSDVDYFVS